MTTDAPGAPTHTLLTGRRLNVVLAALMMTTFLSALDQTIGGSARPHNRGARRRPSALGRALHGGRRPGL